MPSMTATSKEALSMTKQFNRSTILKILLAIFIGGYASLSLELIVLRQLSSFVGTTTITVSIVMGSFLAFMSIGYYRGSELNPIKYSLRRQSAVGFLLIGLLAILSASYILIDIYFMALNFMGIRSNILQTAIYSLIFLSYGPYLFGKITAMLSRYLHYKDRNYTGKIMAVDTLGSVMGSLLTTLITMPFVGVNHSIIILVGSCLLGAILVSRRRKYPYFSGFMLLVSALLFNRDKLLLEIYDIVENNEVSTISIYETDEGKSKILAINSNISSKLSQEHDLNFAYINFINDNFINTIPTDSHKDILIIGAGGFTLGLADKKNSYTYVDIDKKLQAIAEQKFLHQKLGNNKKFVVQDANQFFKESRQKYDLIILDTYSSKHYIPQDLITKEYFIRAKNNLKDGGILVLNSIASANYSNRFSMNLDNTLRAVFPNNLRSQAVDTFNAWAQGDKHNIVYTYYHRPNPQGIYTLNQNTSFYDYEM